MAFVIGLLTFFLVLDCLVLVLLVLIQLPKKEAGVGVAFGGAATDALFGAGSGNVLTKTTKYAAATFFVLSMVLAVMQSHLYHRSTIELRRAIEEQSQQTPGTTPTSAARPATPAPTLPQAEEPASAPTAAPATAPATGSNFMLTVPSSSTNAP